MPAIQDSSLGQRRALEVQLDEPAETFPMQRQHVLEVGAIERATVLRIEREANAARAGAMEAPTALDRGALVEAHDREVAALGLRDSVEIDAVVEAMGVGVDDQTLIDAELHRASRGARLQDGIRWCVLPGGRIRKSRRRPQDMEVHVPGAAGNRPTGRRDRRRGAEAGGRRRDGGCRRTSHGQRSTKN